MFYPAGNPEKRQPDEQETRKTLNTPLERVAFLQTATFSCHRFTFPL